MWDRIRQAQRWGPTAMEQVTRIATHPMTQAYRGLVEALG